MIASIENLTANLRNGIVRFNYSKVDGTLRYAIGTRNPEIISTIIDCANGSINNSARKVSERMGTTTYFDLSRLEFRQFRNDNLISIEMCDIALDDAFIYALTIAFSFADYSPAEFDKLVRVTDNYNKGLGMNVATELADTYVEQLANKDRKIESAENVAKEISHKFFEDHNTRWCRKYNHGYGLNGVSLAAGGIISSGYDCFGNPIGGGRKVATSAEEGGIPLDAVRFISESKPTTERKVEITESKPTTESKLTEEQVAAATKKVSRNKAEILADIAKKHAELYRLYAELSVAEMR